VATRLALTHLSTFTDYTPANDPADLSNGNPPFLVSKSLIYGMKLFLFPPGLHNLFPTKCGVTRDGWTPSAISWETVMAIDAVSNDRASAADRRETARVAAHRYSLARASARRDTRIEEAKAIEAVRPTPAERGAETPPRPPARLVDLFV
jgi:hypothetical protein